MLWASLWGCMWSGGRSWCSNSEGVERVGWDGFGIIPRPRLELLNTNSIITKAAFFG